MYFPHYFMKLITESGIPITAVTNGAWNTAFFLHIINLSTCAGRLQYLVCVCLSDMSVRMISAIACNKTPKKGHHKNQAPYGK